MALLNCFEKKKLIYSQKRGRLLLHKKGLLGPFSTLKQCGLFNARLRSHCVKERVGRIDFATLSRFLQHSKINGNGLAIQCVNINAYGEFDEKSSYTTSRRGNSEWIVYGFVVRINYNVKYIRIMLRSSVVDVPETEDFSVEEKCLIELCVVKMHER